MGDVLICRLEILQSVPLFTMEKRRTLRPWAERLVEERATRGEEVIVQGQEAKRMYVVVSGEAAVLRRPTEAEAACRPANEAAQELTGAALAAGEVLVRTLRRGSHRQWNPAWAIALLL